MLHNLQKQVLFEFHTSLHTYFVVFFSIQFFLQYTLSRCRIRSDQLGKQTDGCGSLM